MSLDFWFIHSMGMWHIPVRTKAWLQPPTRDFSAQRLPSSLSSHLLCNQRGVTFTLPRQRYGLFSEWTTVAKRRFRFRWKFYSKMAILLSGGGKIDVLIANFHTIRSYRPGRFHETAYLCAPHWRCRWDAPRRARWMVRIRFLAKRAADSLLAAREGSTERASHSGETQKRTATS